MSRLSPAAALTTIWTPPCGIDRWYYEPTTSTAVPLSCKPPGWAAYWDDIVSIAYYSPAICPSGFSIGCTRYHASQGPAPLSGESAYLCVQRYSGARDNRLPRPSANIGWPVKLAEGTPADLNQKPTLLSLTSGRPPPAVRTFTSDGSHRIFQPFRHIP